MKKEKQAQFGFVNWGGKRRGAGRKPKGERAGVVHAKRPVLCSRFPVHVTLRLRRGLPSLRYDAPHEHVRRALSVGSERFGFRVVHYSVQSNHVHLVAEVDDERALTRGMRGLTVRLARGLNRLWRHTGKVLADRYHARILRTPREVRNALAYVLQNARKHGAWTAQRPDPYSSAPWFDGWKTSVKTAVAAALPRARTWLLEVGWRRHGLLDPGELPGTG